MGRLVDLAKETRTRELLKRLPTPEELAILTRRPIEEVLVAMAEAAKTRVRRQNRLKGRKGATTRQIARAMGVEVTRLRDAQALAPVVSDKLRQWVAHHAWRPISIRHAARLAGIAPGTAQSIGHGRERSEEPSDGLGSDAIKPDRVARYFCEGCRRWVYLNPCVICAALTARFPEGDEEDTDDTRPI